MTKPATKAKSAKARATKHVVADTFIRDVKALNAAIKDHIAKGADWEKQTHRLLISAALILVSEDKNGKITGQLTPLLNLVEGTLTLTHNNNVARWIEKHCAVVIKDKKLTFSAKRAGEFLKDGQSAYEDLLVNSTPYFKLTKPTKPFDGFDLRAKLAAIVKQAETMLEALEEGVLEKGGETIELDDKAKKKIIVDKDDLATIERLLAHKSKGGVPATLLN